MDRWVGEWVERCTFLIIIPQATLLDRQVGQQSCCIFEEIDGFAAEELLFLLLVSPPRQRVTGYLGRINYKPFSPSVITIIINRV